MLRYYKELTQKEEPETISMDTLKFILKRLDEQNKKVGYDKLSNNNKMIITWKAYNSEELNKGISAVVLEDE